MNTRDAQLRRAVRKACNWLKRMRSAAVVRFFERHAVELKKQLRMGDQHGFFQNIKSVLLQLEETEKVESQCVRDEEGGLLRGKGRICEKWVRFFRSLLNAKSDMLDPDIPKRLPQRPVPSTLGIEPTEEIVTAIKAMPNVKAVEPDGFPVELTKLGLQQDGAMCWISTDLPPSSGARGKSHSSGKMRPLLYSTGRATRRSAETTPASRSCHTRVR